MTSKLLRPYLKPGMWLTMEDNLKKGIWPWTTGVRARLPKHYKIRFVEKHMIEPKPVHYRKEEGRWKLDEWGERIRVRNIPIPATYPPEADEGLWGGEGIVQGLRSRGNHPKKMKTPRMWRPGLAKRLFYSEILDKYMTITVTFRTLDQIDECFGFDYYILKTHEVDLKSKLGMKLKREMLLALMRKTLYPDDPVKREEIFHKYKEFITMSEEEVEWLGLSIEEAEMKQERIEEEERIAKIRPHKYIFMDQLLQKIEDGTLFPEDKEKSMLDKLNPFKKEDKKIE